VEGVVSLKYYIIYIISYRMDRRVTCIQGRKVVPVLNQAPRHEEIWGFGGVVLHLNISSLFSIVTRVRAGKRRSQGSISGRSKTFFSYPQGLGPTQPVIQWVPGVMRQGRQDDHSTPSSVEVKNGDILPLPDKFSRLGV
jgi:hypothetical protein